MSHFFAKEQDNDKKKVDDDEDRSNPQYIPKRGTFYEHDDRTLEDGYDTSFYIYLKKYVTNISY